MKILILLSLSMFLVSCAHQERTIASEQETQDLYKFERKTDYGPGSRN